MTPRFAKYFIAIRDVSEITYRPEHFLQATEMCTNYANNNTFIGRVIHFFQTEEIAQSPLQVYTRLIQIMEVFVCSFAQFYDK